MKRYLTIGAIVIVLAIAGGLAYINDIFTPAKEPASEQERMARAPVPEGMKYYQHSAFQFSILIPEEMEMKTHRERGQVVRTLVFSMPGNEARQFQLYVVPYEGKTITSSQVAKDTRSTAIGTPQEVILENGIPALVFESEDQALGRLREVWFLHNGYLFEFTAPIDQDKWFSGILSTFTPILY